MNWLPISLITAGGVLFGLALRAWTRGEPAPLLVARCLTAVGFVLLAVHLTDGSKWLGLVAPLLVISGTVIQARARERERNAEKW